MQSAMEAILREYVDKVQNLYGIHLKKVILYRFYARGDFTRESDIIILVDLSDSEIKQYSEVLSEITFNMNIDNDLMLMPIVKNQEHFRYWLAAYPFYRNVQNEDLINKLYIYHIRAHGYTAAWRNSWREKEKLQYTILQKKQEFLLRQYPESITAMSV